ncbi:unnamed protein product [Callosobruchus maculatus]|uniref:THAP-type domain-containing protein n=1 Tax=Callosobruchus maculatus TaxID=64391 RepID=A0A653DEY2_CALMS|nr:unnamed protein product [Callosobruchus maculatus]
MICLAEKVDRSIVGKGLVPGTRAVICSKYFKHSDYVEAHMDTLRLKRMLSSIFLIFLDIY